MEQGITLTEATEKAGVSKMTLYRKIKMTGIRAFP